MRGRACVGGDTLGLCRLDPGHLPPRQGVIRAGFGPVSTDLGPIEAFSEGQQQLWSLRRGVPQPLANWFAAMESASALRLVGRLGGWGPDRLAGWLMPGGRQQQCWQRSAHGCACLHAPVHTCTPTWPTTESSRGPVPVSNLLRSSQPMVQACKCAVTAPAKPAALTP